MRRFPLLLAVLFGFFLMGADGCSSDPNVEGAKLDLRNKDYDRALENLAIALEKNPENAEAHELRGQVLQDKAFATTDPDEHTELIEMMVEAYNRAAAIDPTLEGEITNRLRLAYHSEFNRGIQSFNKGNTNDDKDEFGYAAAYFGNASTIQPDSAGAYVNQAFALIRAGNSTAAIAPLEMAIEKGENEPDTYIFLASLYDTDNAGKAVATLEAARDMYPDNADVQAQLLNAYQMAGQMDRAVEVYKAAVESEPDNKLYQYNYGSILLQLDDWDGAIMHLSAATELDPTYANAHYNLGAAYTNKAFELSNKINELDDDLRARRSDLSREEIDKIEAEIDALTEQRRSLFGEAITPLEQARQLTEANEGDVQEICRALFQAYAQTGDTEKAQSFVDCAGLGDSN